MSLFATIIFPSLISISFSALKSLNVLMSDSVAVPTYWAMSSREISIGLFGCVEIKYLRQQLEVALVMKTLATGIGNVLKMSSRWTGSLLLVEKNYSEPTELLECEDGLYTLKEPYSKYSHLHNAVDCIIENVLNNGGDVQFVEKGFLKSVKEITLIR